MRAVYTEVSAEQMFSKIRTPIITPMKSIKNSVRTPIRTQITTQNKKSSLDQYPGFLSEGRYCILYTVCLHSFGGERGNFGIRTEPITPISYIQIFLSVPQKVSLPFLFGYCLFGYCLFG